MGKTTNVYLKNKIDERTSQAQVLTNLQETAAKAGRDLTDDERKTFDGITERLGFLDGEIGRIVKAEEGAAEFVKIYGAHRDAERQAIAEREQAQQRRQAAVGGLDERFLTWGERFVRSEAFKNYNGHGASATFTITGDFLGGAIGSVEERAEVEPEADDNGGFQTQHTWNFPPGTNVTAGGFGDFAPSMMWGGPRQPTLRTPLFDVIGRVPTTMGSVEYYYWYPQLTDDDPMAEEVPEGELKPEAELGGELLAVPISTYAWWKGVTRQALDDIPQIRQVIDGFLRRGVIRKINFEAGQALSSNTDIPELDGGGTELLAVLRAALAYVDMAGYTANSVLINPMDWAAIDMRILELTGNGAVSQNVFWGMRPVPLPGVPSGTAYVGDFNEAINFFDRQQVNVLMTDSHADYFLRNKLVILAEARGKVVVTNAAAMVKVEGDIPAIALASGAPLAASMGSSARARRARQGRRDRGRGAVTRQPSGGQAAAPTGPGQ